MKICSKCNGLFPTSDFAKNKTTKDGLFAWCRSCTREWRRQNYLANLSIHKQRTKKWRESNTEYNRSRNKKWLLENQARRKEYKKIYRAANKEKVNEYKRRRWHIDKNDPIFRLQHTLRRRLRKAIHKIKNTYTEESLRLVGCTLDFLKTFLEAKFSPGMSWENYGKWHIDHMRPVCSFDLTNQNDVDICFHYTNLQPLWAMDNVMKGSKYKAGLILPWHILQWPQP